MKNAGKRKTISLPLTDLPFKNATKVKSIILSFINKIFNSFFLNNPSFEAANTHKAIINNIITTLSKRAFSQTLVTDVVKSVFIYQFMQAEVLTVLQRNFDSELAEDFIEKTKFAIKSVVEKLQQSKLI